MAGLNIVLDVPTDEQPGATVQRHDLGQGGDGLVAGMSNVDKLGQKVEIFYANKQPCVADPPHDWTESRVQWNGGKNDGFINAYQDRHGMGVGPEVMGYQTRKELPISYALADAGTICDRWFCSLMGPTWPNRMYLHAAQSGGLKANTLPMGGLAFPSIWHRLIEAQVPWSYYWSNVPFLALWSDLGRRPCRTPTPPRSPRRRSSAPASRSRCGSIRATTN